MDTLAVSISDIVSKKHAIKWRDYHLLKSIIRKAYLSPGLSHEEVITDTKLSLLGYSSVRTRHIYIMNGYSRMHDSFTVSCLIK